MSIIISIQGYLSIVKSVAHRKKHLITGILFILLLSIISMKFSETSFSDANASQIRDDIILSDSLDKTNSLTQSFIAEKPYLASIKFLLNSNNKVTEKKYSLHVHLLDSRHTEIASKMLSISNASEKLYIEFFFPPQPDSLNKQYYVLLETDAPAGVFFIWVSLFDSYPNGSVFLNETPSQFDLTFWTYYKPSLSFLIKDTFLHSGRRFSHLLFISLVFFLLGWWIRILLGFRSKDMIEGIIYSLVIGICIPPLSFLILGLFGVQINKINILITLGILITSLGLKYLLSFRITTKTPKFYKLNALEATTLGVMFLIAIFTRVAQISDQIMPGWVDGIVHYGFLLKILEKQAMSFGGIYPKGFHANVIFENLLLGGPLPESMLVMGQWLSLVSGLTFYLLARKLLRTPHGLFAVGIYWFWAAFPAFLINWGRYPFLQGLVILPAAITLLQNSFPRTRQQTVSFILMTIGLGLTYYGAFMIFATFLITDTFNRILVEGIKKGIKRIKVIILSLLPIALILFTRMDGAFNNGVFGQASAAVSLEDGGNALEISMGDRFWMIWPLGIIGLILMFVRDYPRFVFLLECILILLAIDVLQSELGITISSFANIIIFLAIPLAMFSALTLKVLLIRRTRYTKLLVYTSVIILAVTGVYNISSLTKPEVMLYTSADQEAVAWISQNTSKDSVFLINSFLWGDAYAPSDGGGWVSFLTKRKSIPFDSKKLEEVIAKQEINYIYVGRGFGDINPNPILADPRFSLVYNREGIRIFRLNP